MAKRANGEGSIWQNSRGTWTAQITTPDGRRSSTFSTQRKARAWLTQKNRDQDTGDYIEPSVMTLGAWWDKWVDSYKRTTSSSSSLLTFVQSRKRIERIDPKFFEHPLANLLISDVQGAINALHDSGLSDRTCELTLVHLRDCLNRAVIDRMMLHNPAKAALPPMTHAVAPIKATPLSDETFDAFILWATSPIHLTADGRPDKNMIAGRAYRDILLFIARTGVRCGEALGLRWTCVNGKTATISCSIDNYGQESQTKTHQNRDVPLSPDVVAMLERRRFAGGEFVFAARSGLPLQHRNVLRDMKQITGHTIHDLRHTYITRAAKAGINPKVLQMITGHRTLDVLLRVYTHVSEKDKADANAKIYASCKPVANGRQKRTKTLK